MADREQRLQPLHARASACNGISGAGSVLGAGAASASGACLAGADDALAQKPCQSSEGSNAALRAAPLLRGIGWVAYVAAVFWCCIQREPRWWTLLPFAGPLVYWLMAFLARRARHASHALHAYLYGSLLAALLLALAAALVVVVRGQAAFLVSPQRIRLFYFLQEAVMLWLLAGVFARSLLPGQVPVCSAVAALSHPVMTPAVWRYTRGVTLAWAVWIAGLWLVSALLFVTASAQAWASFSMGLLPVLVAAFFLLEVLVGRRIFLPRQDRSSLLATLASVRKVNWAAFSTQLLQGQMPVAHMRQPAGALRPGHEARSHMNGGR